MDRVNRASVGAKAAANTLFIVENGEIVIYCNSAVRTGASTLGASDTTV